MTNPGSLLPLCLAAATLAFTGIAGAKIRNPAGQRAAAAGAPVGTAATGMRLYQSCSGCHSIDQDDVGPRHRGVVGRRAGTVPGYAYSAALRNSGIVWTPRLLDRWLSGPQKLVPGTKMYFSVAKPQDRADIIAYLATQR